MEAQVLVQENLGFREMVYGVMSPYVEPLHQFFYDHVFANEQSNPTTIVFYYFMRQEERELYSGSDYATPLYRNARLLNLKISHKVAQTIFDGFLSFMKIIVPRENKLFDSYYDSKKLMKKLGMRVEKNTCMSK